MLLAKAIGLPFCDKPPSPCLATRIEYKERITREQLNMIKEAESILKSMGCRLLRIRLHHDGIARIEVDKADLAFCAEHVLYFYSFLRIRQTLKLPIRVTFCKKPKSFYPPTTNGNCKR